jgi:hypothetical protein
MNESQKDPNKVTLTKSEDGRWTAITYHHDVRMVGYGTTADMADEDLRDRMRKAHVDDKPSQ